MSAVARSMGVQIGYLPGLAMRRIADLYPGEGKTDARDALVIADAARTLPHALRRVGPDGQTVTALGVLAGYDADLAAKATRLTDRLHDALLHVHPALERLLGKHFRRRGVLELLARGGHSGAASRAGRGRAAGGDDRAVSAGWRSRCPLISLAALDEQTVVVPATEQYGRVISGGAAQLPAVLDQRVVVAGELDADAPSILFAEVPTSMPGVARADRGRVAADSGRRQHLRHRRAPGPPANVASTRPFLADNPRQIASEAPARHPGLPIPSSRSETRSRPVVPRSLLLRRSRPIRRSTSRRDFNRCRRRLKIYPLAARGFQGLSNAPGRGGARGWVGVGESSSGPSVSATPDERTDLMPRVGRQTRVFVDRSKACVA